ncbi:MAG: hypothetical protein ACK5LJ_17240 [Paracoccus sp. (in: a-proteobacteria)]
MNRRKFLVVAPATLALIPPAALSEPVGGPDESPVMALFREWKAAFDLVEELALTDMTDAEREPFHQRESELVRQTVHTPARDAIDVCAKLTAFSCDGQHFADDEGVLSDLILREARAFTHGEG